RSFGRRKREERVLDCFRLAMGCVATSFGWVAGGQCSRLSLAVNPRPWTTAIHTRRPRARTTTLTSIVATFRSYKSSPSRTTSMMLIHDSAEPACPDTRSSFTPVVDQDATRLSHPNHPHLLDLSSNETALPLSAFLSNPPSPAAAPSAIVCECCE
ncbi:hypothetical protein C8F01DRAFT_1155883, partial [Mycena amicta]